MSHGMHLIVIFGPIDNIWASTLMQNICLTPTLSLPTAHGVGMVRLNYSFCWLFCQCTSATLFVSIVLSRVLGSLKPGRGVRVFANYT